MEKKNRQKHSNFKMNGIHIVIITQFELTSSLYQFCSLYTPTNQQVLCSKNRVIMSISTEKIILSYQHQHLTKSKRNLSKLQLWYLWLASICTFVSNFQKLILLIIFMVFKSCIIGPFCLTWLEFHVNPLLKYFFALESNLIKPIYYGPYFCKLYILKPFRNCFLLAAPLPRYRTSPPLLVPLPPDRHIFG